MNSAIERLAALVQQAEAKASAKRLGTEIQASAARLRAAEARARAADGRLRESRPALARDIEQVDAEEKTLNDLIQKTAKYKSYLEPSRDRDAERLIDEARAEIVERRARLQAELAEVTREVAEARKELQAALDQYGQLRRELDRLQPQLAADYAGDDRLAAESTSYLPGGQLQALAREIADSANYFGMIDARQQMAQLKIWIGRYRLLQEADNSELTEEQQARLRQVFPELVGISKRFKPGYIEAFQQNYATDWVAYIAEARAELAAAVEESTRHRAYEASVREQQARDEDSRRLGRESAKGALDQLAELVAGGSLDADAPEERAEAFRALLRSVVAGFGSSDPEVIDLAAPYRELVTGNELRALRRNLDRAADEEARRELGLGEQYREVLEAARGRRALMVGGSVREESRRKLERLFEFASLEWIPYESGRPAALDSLEGRVRNRSVDLVLILKYVGHHLTDRLRPACDQANVPYFLLRSYGATQVAETLRRGLPRLLQTTPNPSPKPANPGTPNPGSASGLGVGAGRASASGVEPAD